MFIHGFVASSLAIKVQVEIGEEPNSSAIRLDQDICGVLDYLEKSTFF
jgi:hypothetical protein